MPILSVLLNPAVHRHLLLGSKVGSPVNSGDKEGATDEVADRHRYEVAQEKTFQVQPRQKGRIEQRCKEGWFLGPAQGIKYILATLCSKPAATKAAMGIMIAAILLTTSALRWPARPPDRPASCRARRGIAPRPRQRSLGRSDIYRPYR